MAIAPTPACGVTGAPCTHCNPGPCRDRITARTGAAALDAAIADVVRTRLAHARTKHPVFAEGKYNALGVIASEMAELSHAVEHESDQRAEDEALDVIATCWRFLAGEHGARPEAEEVVHG